MDIFAKDTVAAYATAASSGAVALLRVSGPDSLSVLKTLTGKSDFEPRRAYFVRVHDGKSVLDTAVAVYYQVPKSYTGEDSFELTVHAGEYIKARLLEIVFSLGARLAEPGEFTMRAYLNGKMDLAQAQGVADIIAAKNKSAHRAALNILDGRLSEKFKNIRAALTELLAKVEVRIDDADDEMQALSEGEIFPFLDGVINQIETLAATFSAGRLVKEGIKTAIVGVPNSGKSSLLNALLGFDRAIVSPVSGTTRDTVDAVLKINDFSLVLTDTAGIRADHSDAAEAEGIERSRKAMRSADIIIFLADLHADAAAQEEILKEALSTGKKVLKVLNKTDLPLAAEAKAGEYDCFISCKTGAGLEDLKNKITSAIGLSALQEDDILITSAAHYKALKEASAELRFAKERFEELELMAEHIRRALLSLRRLIGEVTPDDVLGEIFSKFCVGK